MLKGVKTRWSLLLICFVIASLVWSAVFIASLDDLQVVFLDVGQGDAIFIRSPIGHKVLLDAGVDNSIDIVLDSFLPFFSRQIDLFIVSHPHLDHYGGFNYLLTRYTPSGFIESQVDSRGRDSANYQKLLNSLREREITKYRLSRGARIILGGGAYLDIIYPSAEHNFQEDNRASIIAQLVYGENSFLLTGDADHYAEQEVLRLHGPNLDSDVLKVSHHGSRTGSHPEFIKQVSPDWAIISAGLNNSYGHPHQEVLDILENNGIKILGTYKQGNIKMTSDGQEIICHNCY